MRTIFAVDDDVDFLDELRMALEPYSYNVVTNPNPDDAVRQAREINPDCILFDLRMPKRHGLRFSEALKLLRRANEIALVILDVMMPGPSGLDILAEIKKMDPDLGIIILTGHSSKDVAIEALKGRADDFIEKPIEPKRIAAAVERLLDIKSGKDDTSLLSIKDKIDKVMRFIEKNRYKKTTLKEAADAVCLSPKYLSRIFRECAKKGFTEYKLSVKIGAARDLLAKGGYNIDQISYKLGYENSESFIRQFKKLMGQTPTGYRKKVRNKMRKDSMRRRAKRAVKRRR